MDGKRNLGLSLKIMRLQSYLAQCGVASRRKSAEVIESGQVKVNGTCVKERGFAVDPGRDKITVSGNELRLEEKVYYLFHKPVNVVTSSHDPEGRKTVVDFFRSLGKRVYPVGRLDRNTTGLLLVTNDGDFADHLIHPRHGLKKTYEVLVSRPLIRKEMARFASGIQLDDVKTRPCEIKAVKKSGPYTLYSVILGEGRNRQIRKMMEVLGVRVVGLHRSKIGSLGLGP